MKNKSWDKFTQSGSVTQYLKYKDEISEEIVIKQNMGSKNGRNGRNSTKKYKLQRK